MPEAEEIPQRLGRLTDTAIAADKVAAYRATQYRIGGSEPFTLSIGKQSDALLQLYKTTGQTCGLFITAFNPFGRAQSAEANEAAHSRLGECLRALSPHVIEGAGYPADAWPPELSFFALGIDEGAARQLGRRFDQDAVVWAGADAVPRLLLLR
jgi:hypothetical protein